MTAPARRAAFHALRLIASSRVDLGEALRRARDPLRDIRDRALATDLVTGTLRWRARLDYQLERFSSKALPRLDEEVLDILRLATYQLLYLARVPASAVVNDSVALAKAAKLRSAGGFVNAVLRRLSNQRDALTWPTRPIGTQPEAARALIDYLSVVHSHPGWLVQRWVDRYGVADAERWLEFNNQPAAITIATNRLHLTKAELATRLDREAVNVRATSVAPNGLIVTSGHVLSSDAFREGAFVIQDEASQIIPELVRAKARDRVLDACASPGGKTVALAAQARDGLIVATDVRARRVRSLVDTLRRCRVSNVRVVHIPPRGALPFSERVFDCVLVDAPCSGLGTLRRDPDIRWRRTLADLPAMADLQRELLLRLRPHLKFGGRLVYSTCSSEPEENEDVIAWFLRTASEFRVVPLRDVTGLPDSVVGMSTADGYLRTTPLHGLEAFFGAVLERSLG